MVPPLPIPRVPKTLETREIVEVAETTPLAEALRKPAPVASVSAEVEAPPLKVWREVQEFADPRSDALVVRQVPFTEKQPLVRFTPCAKVEEAVPVRLRAVACTPHQRWRLRYR